MITPVYGSWCSHKTTESQKVFAGDSTPSKSSVLRADAIVGKTGNVLGCGLEGAIPKFQSAANLPIAERVVGGSETKVRRRS